ncbi:sodium ion-translocating decarboxylase subunit beta, partial [Escherichia coli]|nr:sodium ion-translocating decarboxylase subunit beta [Escherichia coli]
MGLLDSLITFLQGMGIFSLSWQMVGMWGIAILLLYLGVAKQYEPLLMVPIAFGALIANIPDNGMLISQMNQQVISSNEKGQVTATSLNNVGYLRVHVAPLQEAPIKVPDNLTTPEARAQYLERMHQPMQVYPGKQLTVSQIKSVRESQERAKADAAALGDDSLVVDPNLKEFSNVSDDNVNNPVFLLTREASTIVVRQQGTDYFDTSGNRIPVDLKTDRLEPLVVSAAGKYVAVGQQTREFMITSIHGGLYDWIGLGIKAEIFPPIIFLGVGALTDFGPLLAAPRTLLLGAAAQVGVAAPFFMALFMRFTPEEAASIGIIGGADGPTSIFLTMKLAPHLLGAVAVAAYTYMALVPLIQPPIMALLTTKKERVIRMKSLRQVSKGEKLFFAVLVTIVTILLIPDAAPLIGMLMLGNFMRECKVTERLVQASQNEIINIVTIFLGTSVGLTMQGDRFLQPETLLIILLGIVAFGVATAGGVIAAKLMKLIWRKNPGNP